MDDQRYGQITYFASAISIQDLLVHVTLLNTEHQHVSASFPLLYHELHPTLPCKV